MIEKPVMAKNLNTIFRNYKTEKEDTSNKQVEELVEILKERTSDVLPKTSGDYRLYL